MKPIVTHNLGFPCVGEKAELERALEAYVQGESTREALERVGSELRRQHWKKQTELGMDLVPCGDFSYFEQVLDTTCMLGNIPERFAWRGAETNVDTRLMLTRGLVGSPAPTGGAVSIAASETATWFDGMKYVVPEFGPETTFSLASWHTIKDFNEAGLCGLQAKPVLLGPLSYLSMGKVRPDVSPEFSRYTLLERIVPIYVEVLRRLTQWGAQWIQFDEPMLALQLSPAQRDLLRWTYSRLKSAAPRLKLLLATVGEMADNLEAACDLDCDGLHIDAVHAPGEIEAVVERLPSDRVLSLGIVDGRSTELNDFEASLRTIAAVRSARADAELWLAPSCSLTHLCAPSLALATSSIGVFEAAYQKLTEVNLLRELAEGNDRHAALDANRAAWSRRRAGPNVNQPGVAAQT